MRHAVRLVAVWLILMSLVQSRGGTAGVKVLQYSSPVVVGNWLVATHCGNGTDAGASCADDVNGAWTKAVARDASGRHVSIFYFAATAAGTPTVTLTESGIGSNQLDIFEVDDLPEGSSLIDFNSSDNNNTQSHSSGSITLPRAGFAIFASQYSDNANGTTAPTDYTAIDTGSRAIIGYRVLTSGLALTGTWTSGDPIDSDSVHAGFVVPEEDGGGEPEPEPDPPAAQTDVGADPIVWSTGGSESNNDNLVLAVSSLVNSAQTLVLGLSTTDASMTIGLSDNGTRGGLTWTAATGTPLSHGTASLRALVWTAPVTDPSVTSIALNPSNLGTYHAVLAGVQGMVFPVSLSTTRAVGWDAGQTTATSVHATASLVVPATANTTLVAFLTTFQGSSLAPGAGWQMEGEIIGIGASNQRAFMAQQVTGASSYTAPWTTVDAETALTYLLAFEAVFPLGVGTHQARAGIARANTCRGNYFTSYEYVYVNSMAMTGHVVERPPLTLTDAMDHQPSTLTLELVGPPLIPSYGNRIALAIGSKENRVFSGTIQHVAIQQRRQQDRPHYRVSAIDNAGRHFPARQLTGRYSSIDASSIVKDLVGVANLTGAVAFTTQAVQDSMGLIEELTFINATPDEAITRTVRAVGGHWYVDARNNAHAFTGAENQPLVTAPEALTTTAKQLIGLSRFEVDASQWISAVRAEGRMAEVLAAVPAGYGAAPVTMWDAPTGGDTTNEARAVRLGPQRFSATSIHGRLSNPKDRGAVTSPVPVGVNTLAGISTNLANNAPSWCQIGESWIYFGASSGNTIFDIPSSTAGNIATTLTVGMRIVEPTYLSFATSEPLLIDLEPGEPVVQWVEAVNSTAAQSIAALQGGNGLRYHTVQQDGVTPDGLLTIATAELTLRATPDSRGSYRTRDRNAWAGGTVTIDVTSPTNINSVTAKLTRVSVSQIEDGIDRTVVQSVTGYGPLRDVEFSSARLRDLIDILADVERRR